MSSQSDPKNEVGELKRENALLKQQVESLRHFSSTPKQTLSGLLSKSGLTIPQIVFFGMILLAVLYLFGAFTE